MTLREYLRVLRERWRIIVVILLLTVAVSILLVQTTARSYQARAQVLVSSNASSTAIEQFGGAQYVTTLVQTFAAVVGSPDVTKAVRRDLNLDLTDTQLKAKLSGTVPTGQTIVMITATDGSASEAAAIANSAARAFIDAVQKYSTPTNSKVPTVHLTVTGPATAPSTPVAPTPGLDITVGVLLGLVFGVAAAVLRELLDNRIKTAEALQKVAGRPVLGVVVDDANASRHTIAARAGGRNSRAENFRQLRANLQYANVDSHPRVIAVTSSIAGEGKTSVAVNLASTLAEAGFSVCLVDADLRRPTIAKVLKLPGQVGLTNVLIHQIDLDDALQVAGTNLHVLASGPTPPNPSEVLASSYVREVIRSLLGRVDYVILDTAPLLPVADASEVAALADGVLLVARYKVTTDAQFKRSTSMLKQVDAQLFGAVLNRYPNNRSRGYGYTYYRADPADQAPKNRFTRRSPQPQRQPRPAAPSAESLSPEQEPIGGRSRP